MKVYKYPDSVLWADLLKRPAVEAQGLEDVVKGVFDDVIKEGDIALKKYTSKFDGVEIDHLKVSVEEITNAKSKVDEPLKQAIFVAKDNIEKFHRAQILKEEVIETTEGVECWRKQVGIDSVGLYIPGGTAPLFSTVLMLGIPAVLAGCQQIVLCSPPDEHGELNPAILFAADLVGIKEIYKIGGIQAIAAMTLGTETIPKTYKLFGPGNQYVTAAKQYAQKYNVAIDMPAGPSEVLIIADETADASFVASDLLAQAEHGADSQVILLAYGDLNIEEVLDQIKEQCDILPRREIAMAALKNSCLVVVKNKEAAATMTNMYAPEHLIIASKDEDYFIDTIRNAGSVFLGNYTPESAGDYASGTNHTLPTNGFARSYSGVSLESFVRKITYQKISKKGIANLGPSIEVMAEAEELIAHKNAVTIRLNKLKADV